MEHVSAGFRTSTCYHHHHIIIQVYFRHNAVICEQISHVINVKKLSVKTQSKGDLSHASKTAKITVFDPIDIRAQ